MDLNLLSEIVSRGGPMYHTARRIETYRHMLAIYINRRDNLSGPKCRVRISETFMARAPKYLLTKIFNDALCKRTPNRVDILILDPFCKAAEERYRTICADRQRGPRGRAVTGLTHLLEALLKAEASETDPIDDKIPNEHDQAWNQPVESAEGGKRELRRRIFILLSKIQETKLVRQGIVNIKFYRNDFFPLGYLLYDVGCFSYGSIQTTGPEHGNLNGNQFERPFVFCREGPGSPSQAHAQIVDQEIMSFDYRFEHDKSDAGARPLADVLKDLKSKQWPRRIAIYAGVIGTTTGGTLPWLPNELRGQLVEQTINWFTTSKDESSKK